MYLNPLKPKFIKWSNTLKEIVGKLPTICLSVFDHFSGLALKGLKLVSALLYVTHFIRLASFLSKTSLIVPTKFNYEILNTKVGLKYYKLYYSQRDISATLVEGNPLKMSENQRFSDFFKRFKEKDQSHEMNEHHTKT